MTNKNTKQTNSFIKKKVGSQLGYRTSDFFKAKTFSGFNRGQKFNQAQFKTQHKG